MKTKPKNESGFTLIEIMISIGILSIIAALGLFLSMNFYRGYSFRSERDVMVSVLQKARGQSLSNINQTRHGVHFVSDQYILFECPTLTPQCTSHAPSGSDLTINSSYKNVISTPSLPFDVIFSQLDGNCIVTTGANPFNCDPTTQSIKGSDGANSYNIKVNNEGQIDW